MQADFPNWLLEPCLPQRDGVTQVVFIENILRMYPQRVTDYGSFNDCFQTDCKEPWGSTETTAMSPEEPTEIEVEVLEIDGVAPLVPQVRAADVPLPEGERRDWRNWQGRLLTLDSRWWPLWVLLGSIALVIALTVGLVVGVIYLIMRLILKIVRAILQ